MIELTFLKKLILIKQMNQKECDICHYWYFLDKGFRFQTYVYNDGHDLSRMSMNLNDIAILNINGINYRFDINGVRKSEAVNLLQNADVIKKSGVLYMKMDKKFIKFREIEIEKHKFH